MKLRNYLLSFTLISAAAVAVLAQGGYKQPPKEIVDVLDAPSIPTVSVSPSRDRLALLEPLRYPPISELAQPMLRLAGLRINPLTNAQHRQPYAVSLRFRSVADGSERGVQLPQNVRIVSPQWSPDGKYLAFGNAGDKGVELWIAETATGKARRLGTDHVNTAFGEFSWSSPTELLVHLVPSKRGPMPSYRDLTPGEPNIQETSGKKGSVQTFQDLLKSPNDEALFEYFATSQIALIGVDGKTRTIGTPGIVDDLEVSPDGKYILAVSIKRPFSYLFPYNRFPRTVAVWDMSGRELHKIAESPLLDNLPIQGVPTGPRSVSWIPTEPATLMWAEALDGGDPRNKAEKRDKLMKLAAPFHAPPTELLRTEWRYSGRQFGEKDGLMLFYDFDRDTRRRRIFITDHRQPSEVRLLSDLNTADRYNDMGQPVTKMLPSGNSVIRQNGDSIFLIGSGASPQGDRPFLRKLDLKTMKTEEIFRSGTEKYEMVLGVADDAGTKFITRRESVTEPPNIFLREACAAGGDCPERQLTNFTDPSPQLRGITKQLVKYKRADGVDLSFTLYLPPGYKQGTRLPTVVWAYPLEFTDASTAGQVSGSVNRFTQIGGTSHLFFLLRGYAVLDDATMPIVGNPETVNDTFVKQIVDSAQAAIDKGVEMGVVDRDRVGVGGHSYGAFMTANLLAHSDIFKAGIARSGAYNRTLTPFGFQSERRSFWEAPELYAKVSPFFFANKINEPILLIHGEADNNQGTFPMQSERMYAAISGNGGTARLVMLPLESHGYAARESVGHTLYEMIDWFDRYVKK